MAARKLRESDLAPIEPGPRAAGIFAANQRMNQLLLEQIAPDVWIAKPHGNVRNIAAIFSHIQNARTKWIRLTAPHIKTPRQVSRGECSQQDVTRALAESAARCETMLIEALGADGRIKEFRRDGWARPMPVGPEMLCYMIAHEAHHRGQVCMIAHQLGFPLPGKVTSAMWNWEKLLK